MLIVYRQLPMKSNSLPSLLSLVSSPTTMNLSKDWLFVVSRDNIFPSVCLLVAQSATGGTLDSLRSLLGIPSVELFFIDVIIYW